MSSLPTVQILLGSRCYLVPRDQLISQSGFFQALYRSGMRESHGEVVKLHGLSPEGLEGVLRHITGGPLQESDSQDDSDCCFQDISGESICNDYVEAECESEQDVSDCSSKTMSLGPLQALVETASFLQVQGLLTLLQSSLSLDNCLELLEVSQVHGQWDLASASLHFMATNYHSMLKRPDFQESPELLHDHVLQERLCGVPALLLLCQPLQGLDTWQLLRYQEAGGGWHSLPCEVPQSMVKVQGYGATTLHNYIFVAGGRRENGQEIGAVHSYNPSTGCWTQEASMNQKRCNFRLLAVCGALYAVGGQSLANMECYLPTQDVWTPVAPLPETLIEFSACESQGKIYVVGGYTPRGRNLSILRYSPLEDEWSVFDVCKQHVRKQQMVSLEETLFTVGGCVRDGQSGQSEDSLSVRSYNTTARTWSCLKVNTSKSGLSVSCTLHNDGIYILSRDVSPSTVGRHRIFLKYNVFSETCEYVRSPPSEGKNMQLFSLYLPHVL
ncbi:kelch-like protein 42 [Bombina bombina]|uniref:kelch-like protein 42 n=1 Tax=Bombina bombina TaxID=8345 RepID=UPI00235A5E22|nr:kelch-like protein 42 [Bombina bombina]XP_053574777.1 kelch-like protein 42 [Bombina bombina]